MRTGLKALKVRQKRIVGLKRDLELKRNANEDDWMQGLAGVLTCGLPFPNANSQASMARPMANSSIFDCAS